MSIAIPGGTGVPVVRIRGPATVHQDFGYWHQQGMLVPDEAVSCMIAVDEANRENGCLQVHLGSHAVGRLAHGTEGEQAGADPRFVDLVRKRFPAVMCDMGPGDVLFFHPNLVHWSAANTSPNWRRAMIVAFNGVRNSPWVGNGVMPVYGDSELTVVGDDQILLRGPVHHSADRFDFLDHETNAAAFAEGIK